MSRLEVPLIHETLWATGDLLLRLCDVLQEAADIAGRKVAGMPLAVEEDQAARPLGVALAGTVLPEARQRHLADEVEQSGRLRGDSDGGRCRGQACTSQGLTDAPGVKCTPE